MSGENSIIHLQLTSYSQPGLYLRFKDGTQLSLTPENIERVTAEYWADPQKIAPDIKEAVDFQRCTICPLRKKTDLCDALRPILPLLSVVDRYNSYDSVLAVYKGTNNELYHVSDTTLQRAMRYISNLSLMSYCRLGRNYRKYFAGIIPVLATGEIANRLFLNIYWFHEGDAHIIDSVISNLNKDITMTTRNQLQRLRLICKNDAFLNAFILTHLMTEELNDTRDKKLKKQMEALQQDPSSLSPS